MKYLLIGMFLFCFNNCYGQNASDVIKMIRVEHIGSSDKPIYTVVFCTEKYKPATYERVVVLSSKNFEIVSDFVEKNQTKKIKPESYEFGVFNVIVKKPGNSDQFYTLPTRVYSINYFKKLKEVVPSQYSNFHEAVKELLMRIRLE